MGLWARKRVGHDAAGLTHHSDRGVQYRAIRYTERLDQANAVASVGSRGDSFDNAMAEALNSLFKAECIRTRPCDPTAAGRTSRRWRSPSPSTSTGTTTADSTARSESSHRRSRGPPPGHQQPRPLPQNTRPSRRRIQVTEPPRHPGRFTCRVLSWPIQAVFACEAEWPGKEDRTHQGNGSGLARRRTFAHGETSYPCSLSDSGERSHSGFSLQVLTHACAAWL